MINDNICPHCNKEIERPYDLKTEILNILESHPVPLTRSEIRRYLANGNYNKLKYCIEVTPTKLMDTLIEMNHKSAIQIPDPNDDYEKTYYTTPSLINQKWENLK